MKKFKFRVVSLDRPMEDKLISATMAGIWQCIRLFTEAPPRGSKNNFGLNALQHWAKMLTNTRNKNSWARYFPPGGGMFAALAGDGLIPGLYEWINAWGDGSAERKRYAQFLDEAAILLDRPALKEAGEIFRQSAVLWRELAENSLPSDKPILHEAGQLIDQRYLLFTEKGAKAENEIRSNRSRQKDLLKEAKEHFPLSETEAISLRGAMSEIILRIREVEERAIASMQRAMA